LAILRIGGIGTPFQSPAQNTPPAVRHKLRNDLIEYNFQKSKKNKMKTMSKLSVILITLFFVFSCIKSNDDKDKQEILNYEMNCIKDSTYFYYTIDYERIYLELSTLCITIKFNENVSQEYFNYLIGKNYQLDSITYVIESDNLAYGWLSTDLMCIDIKEILMSLSKESKVVCANPNFILKDAYNSGANTNDFNALFGLTDEFVVKLKNSVPLSFLNTLVFETKTRIVEQTDFYYIISADKYSRKNSLEASRLFYETDKFEYCHPNFLANIEIHNKK
jgi:uncharacterized membrane protein YciS (DUF1049 family)